MKKFILFTMTALAVLTFDSCKKEGCTNADADNYDSSAKKDDGSCTYTGRHVIWYNSATAVNLAYDGITSLTYYVDGAVVGSSSASVYWTGSPDCGTNGSITVSKNLGTSNSKSFSYSVKDQDDAEVWSGTLNFVGNQCTAFQLTY